MLKLQGLEISGFKSFVDPVKVRFAGGINAIVGPNGCGKSNLSDAITWVLGEQSAKSLRSEKMEDVIFNGCATRRPVGMAEVTLVLATDVEMMGAVDGKILLSRRVFRSGESQYRLNGKVVRLKQIKDLLMDTGLGTRAYSVIEQGKIGMILSGKPQERRKLIEEAAGVTRYKARKRIAEVKLEEATANLLRLEDIISEVRRALGSLKRQAKAARRYQEQEQEYRSLLRQVLQGRWVLQRDRLAEFESELTTRVDHDAQLAADLHRGQAAVVRAREALEVLARGVAERHQEQAVIAATIEGRQEFLKGARQRREEIRERMARGKTQTAERQQQITDLGQSLGGIDQRTVELVAEHAAAEQLVAEDEARIAAAEKNVIQAEARLENLRQALLQALAQLNQLRGELQHQQVEIEKRNYRRRYLEDERNRLDAQLAEAQAAIARSDEKSAATQELLSQRERERLALGQNLEALLRREAELADERQQLESHLRGLSQRQQILSELSAEHQARQATLFARLREIGVLEPRFLAAEIHAPAGWEAGIDHFLGELTEAVILQPEQDALHLAERLSQLNGAGVFLRPLDSPASAVVEPEDPAITHSLAEALALPPELARALPPAYLTRKAVDAARLAAEVPGVAFISRDRLWAQGGVLHVQGNEAAPGVLARTSELEAIAAEIPETEKRRDVAGSTLKQVAGERTRIAGEIHRTDEHIAELRRDLAVAQARRQDVVARQEKLRRERATVVEEQEELGQELATATTVAAQQGSALTAAEARYQEQNASFDRTQLEVEAAKAEREAQRTAGAGRRGRLELLAERLAAQNQEAVRVQRMVAEYQKQITVWEQEQEALERRERELELGIEQAEDQLQIALENKDRAQEAVLAEQQRLDLARDQARQDEEHVERVRAERDVLRSDIERIRIAQASERQAAEHLAVTFREEFKQYFPGTAPGQRVIPETALAEPQAVASADAAPLAGGLAPPAEGVVDADSALALAPAAVGGEPPYTELAELPPMTPARLAELEAALARAKTELERLGPVNVLAAQEFDEQEQRYDFLTTQRDDVRNSVDSLKQTIQEINQTSNARFRETFVLVNQMFGQMFTRLFHGGEAEMHLLDEEDPLETGIEIIARPPGKRTQNLMLLSGGEKALTAVALLFALFQAKPSPFCILDEVDAPLDDVNVLRFAETLQSMARDTQFLIITHNKLTMEAASTLYGVTMEEKGVSKLVAVELEELHPRTRAASA